MGWSWHALGNRPAFFPAVAFGLGVVFGPWLGISALWWLLLASLACLLGWLRGRRPGGIVMGLVMAAGLGAALAAKRCQVSTPPVGQRVVLEGEVLSTHRQGFTLDVSSVDDKPAEFAASLFGESTRPIVSGQRVRVETRLKPITEPSNPGEWNQSEWAHRRGQPVGGSYRAERLVVLTEMATWRRWLTEGHRALTEACESLGVDSAATALFLTLAAGQRAALGSHYEDVFARSGLAHVLSVSGLHVAVLAFLLFGLLRWGLSRFMANFTRLNDPRAYAGLMAIPLVWAYVLYTGWQGPAVRSALMCSLVLTGWTLLQRSDPLNALALAGLWVMTVDTASPFELSMQLSFVAVAALILVAPSVRALIPLAPPSPSTQTPLRLRLTTWREAAIQTFAASVAVTFSTAPLVMTAFQRVSLAGLISNVVTIPLTGLLTLLSAGGAALHLFWAKAALPVLWLGLKVSELFIFIAQSFSELPGASWPAPAPPSCAIVVWWVGLGFWVLGKGPLRWVALIAPAVALAHFGHAAPKNEFSVTFLAVGHGDAAVLSIDGHHALIDGGGVPEGHDTGAKFVIPFLKHQQIEQLDLAVLSHAHPDHGLGLISTLEEIPTRRLWIPTGETMGPLLEDLLEAAQDAQVEEQEVGSAVYALGQVELTVLGPPKDRTNLEHENDRSLVVHARHGEVSFLFAGDLEAPGEALLPATPVTVLKAPHHGSDTSSTSEFVARTKPRFVVFCVGRQNRFGFPKPDVVARWRDAGATCYRTDSDGAITFVSDGRDVRVKAFLSPAATTHFREQRPEHP